MKEIITQPHRREKLLSTKFPSSGNNERRCSRWSSSRDSPCMCIYLWSVVSAFSLRLNLRSHVTTLQRWTGHANITLHPLRDILYPCHERNTVGAIKSHEWLINSELGLFCELRVNALDPRKRTEGTFRSRGEIWKRAWWRWKEVARAAANWKLNSSCEQIEFSTVARTCDEIQYCISSTRRCSLTLCAISRCHRGNFEWQTTTDLSPHGSQQVLYSGWKKVSAHSVFFSSNFAIFLWKQMTH